MVLKVSLHTLCRISDIAASDGVKRTFGIRSYTLHGRGFSNSRHSVQEDDDAFAYDDREFVSNLLLLGVTYSQKPTLPLDKIHLLFFLCFS